MVILWSCDIMFGDFSHMLLVLHAKFRKQMGYYNFLNRDSHQSCIYVHIAMDICVVPMADAVATTQGSLYTVCGHDQPGVQ